MPAEVNWTRVNTAGHLGCNQVKAGDVLQSNAFPHCLLFSFPQRCVFSFGIFPETVQTQLKANPRFLKHRETHTTQSYLTWKLFWVWSSILSWKQQQHSAVLSCSRWCFCSVVGRTLDSLSSPCQAQLLIAAQLISVRFRIQISMDG